MLLLAVFATALVGRRPVLLRVSGNVRQQHPLYILNPFRDRGPERAAEAVLREVSNGGCQAVALRLSGKFDPQCARDTELHIIAWRVRAREDGDSNDVLLLYEVKRDFGDVGTYWDPYWFEVRRLPDRKWKVMTRERWF